MPTKPAIGKLAADRPPLAVIVTDRIRNAIMTAELRLGAALSEDKLAASFGVSRTPVREALTALAHQGLIVIRPKRGSFVFLPSEEDIAELCEFRLLLEGKALAWSHARAKGRTLTSIVSANQAMRRALEEKNGLRSTIADAQFHDAFVTGCGNRDLAQAYSAIAGRLAAVRANLHATTAQTASANEHDAIVQGFKNNNLDQAMHTLSEHIYRMRERYQAANEAGLFGAPSYAEA